LRILRSEGVFRKMGRGKVERKVGSFDTCSDLSGAAWPTVGLCKQNVDFVGL
jgi:hypothetical protein